MHIKTGFHSLAISYIILPHDLKWSCKFASTQMSWKPMSTQKLHSGIYYKAAIPKFCKTWKQPRWPSVGEWIKAVVLIYPFSGVFITQQWKEMSYSARKRQEGTLNTSC